MITKFCLKKQKICIALWGVSLFQQEALNFNNLKKAILAGNRSVGVGSRLIY